jgi:hypothetical protein
LQGTPTEAGTRVIVIPRNPHANWSVRCTFESDSYPTDANDLYFQQHVLGRPVIDDGIAAVFTALVQNLDIMALELVIARITRMDAMDSRFAVRIPSRHWN